MNSNHESEHKGNCIFVNEFNEYAVREFKNDLDRLLQSNLPVIPIYIDSFGGEAYSLLAMIDMIENVDVPVATIAVGKAMSCGSILLACGSPGLRFAGRNSTIMIHDASTISVGKIEELKADVGEASRLNNLILEMFSKKCGHKNKNYFKDLIGQKKHINWFLNAEEAKKHGLIDHIGLPTLDCQYNMNIRISPSVQRKKKQSNK